MARAEREYHAPEIDAAAPQQPGIACATRSDAAPCALASAARYAFRSTRVDRGAADRAPMGDYLGHDRVSWPPASGRRAHRSVMTIVRHCSHRRHKIDGLRVMTTGRAPAVRPAYRCRECAPCPDRSSSEAQLHGGGSTLRDSEPTGGRQSRPASCSSPGAASSSSRTALSAGLPRSSTVDGLQLGRALDDPPLQLGIEAAALLFIATLSGQAIWRRRGGAIWPIHSRRIGHGRSTLRPSVGRHDPAQQDSAEDDARAVKALMPPSCQ